MDLIFKILTNYIKGQLQNQLIMNNMKILISMSFVTVKSQPPHIYNKTKGQTIRNNVLATIYHKILMIVSRMKNSM